MEKESPSLADIGLKLGPRYPLSGYLTNAKQIKHKAQARIRGTRIGGGTLVMQSVEKPNQ